MRSLDAPWPPRRPTFAFLTGFTRPHGLRSRSTGVPVIRLAYSMLEMPVYGLVITLSDAEFSTQQSERVPPALASAFGTDAITEVATWGRYHMWRLTHTIEAPTMLEAAEGMIRMAREAGADAAGIHPGQAVGFSSQLRADSPHSSTSSSFRWGRDASEIRVLERGSASDPGADS